MSTDRIPDLARIRALDALDVGLDLNLIHRNVAKPRADRWAWIQCSSECYLSFGNGAYYDHKVGHGGGAIDLVMQSYDHDAKPDQGRFREAIQRIACHYGMWRDFGPLRRRAADLAQPVTPDLVAQQLTTLGGIPQCAEARRLIEALGLQWTRMTWAIHMANVGFSPAVPWQGQAIARKEDGGYGGWTRKRAQEWTRDAFALRIVCVDLDGADGVAPRIDLVERLMRDLAERCDMPTRACVISSWAGEGRGKFHLYFVSPSKARDEAEYLRWHQVAWDRIAECVGRWSGESSEAPTFKPDPGPASVQRIMRIPGYDKFGRDSKGHAATLYQEPDRSAFVDFTALAERQNTVIHGLKDDGTGRIYTYGETVAIEERKMNRDEELEKATYPAASHVYPLALYRQAETDEHGIRYLYRSTAREWRYGTLPLSACAERSAGRKHAARAADAGVALEPRGADAFTGALGQWAKRKQQAGEVDHVNLVRTPGWHRAGADGWVYVNGTNIHGAGGWYADSHDPRIITRSHRGGELDAWRASIARVADGPFFILTLGYSLAGPLCEWLGIGSTILHIAGASSTGKSTAARLAASVWGDPTRTERTWNSTINGFELMAEEFSGACLWIDELQNFSGDAAAIGRHIHAITSGVGRTRSTRTGDPAAVRSWACTVISTGETTIQDRAGDHWQGGHGVRALDIALDPGETVTRDAAHAREVDAIASEQYGHAGDAWIRHLLATGRERVRATYETWRARAARQIPEDAGIEAERVITRAVAAFAALEEAHEAGLTPWGEKALSDALSWLLRRVLRQREESASRTPCERAYAVLCGWYESERGRFPNSADRARATGIIGLTPSGPDEGLWIYTKPSMLKRANFYSVAAVGQRDFTSWLEGRGLCTHVRGSVPGHESRGRWLRIRIAEDETADLPS